MIIILKCTVYTVPMAKSTIIVYNRPPLGGGGARPGAGRGDLLRGARVSGGR